METNSVDEMLKWLKEEPRTKKWDAILAYDRTKTNTVLMQEYIGRFSSGDYLEPITEEITDNTTPTQMEYIVDYVFDSPRLSFINSSLENSKAQLDMKVIGGSHLTFSKPEGSPAWSISKIAQEDSLDGPRVVFDIDLMVSPGSVSSAGQVQLKLDGGTNYRLTYVDTPHLQRVAGERMKRRFSVLPEKQKTFVLNEVNFTSDQFLKPKDFFIRTHNKKGAGTRLLANEDDNEGAVLLFITMEGGTNGDYPASNGDLRYLLPDEYSATVLLSHEIIKEKIMAEGLRRVNQTPEFEYTPIMQDGAFYGIRGRKGGLRIPGGLITTPNFDLEIPELNIDFVADPQHPLFPSFFSFLTPGYRLPTDGSPETRYCGLAVVGLQEQGAVLHRLFDSPLGLPGKISYSWSTSLTMELVIENGDVVFKPRPVLPPFHENYEVDAGTFEFLEIVNGIELIVPKIKEWMHDAIQGAYERFKTVLPRINTFTLNSLLFRGENSVQLESVNFPADMAIFGQVGPTQTAFSISPLEMVLGHSDEYSFTTEPPRSDVTWKVENIPGSTGNPGTIDPTSGLYKAPTADQLERDHTRVKITATAGTHSSSALVAVLRRDITINPLVQTATAGDTRGRELSAGTLDGGALRWSVDPGSGARVEPSLIPEGDHTYFPGSFKPDTGFSIDTVEVTNPRTGKKEYSTVLVLHGIPIFTLIIDKAANLPANKVQLVIVGADGKPVAPGVLDLTWEVLAGSGQVDPKTGVFTVDPAGADKFAVITTTLPSPMPGVIPASQGYIILPLPLFSVPETIRMLSLDGQ